MLESLHIKNFKCFDDTERIKIYPLTILVGPNSSGKTSFIQSLLALKQTRENIDPLNSFLADGQYVNLGIYSDFIYNHKEREEFLIGIEFKPRFNIAFEKKEKRTLGEFISVELTFGLNLSKSNVELREINFQTKPEFFSFTAKKLKRSNYYDANFKGLTREGQPVGEPLKKMLNNKFYSLSPSRYTWEKQMQSKIKYLFYYLHIVQSEFENFFDNLFHLEPLREHLKRIFIISGARPRNVGLSGELATNLLFYSRIGKSKEKELFNLVNKWVKELGIGSKIGFKTFQAGGVGQLKVGSPYVDLEVNLCDIGFGVSQILPIIVQGFFAPANATFIIEQPEIHLHPNIQSKLGDLFVQLVKNYKKNLIIETHSEHLISRIRRRVADKTIDKEILGIYYFQIDKDQRCRIRKLEINGLGQTIDWPEGFFEEEYKETLEISKIISQRSKENEPKTT